MPIAHTVHEAIKERARPHVVRVTPLAMIVDCDFGKPKGVTDAEPIVTRAASRTQRAV